MLTGHPENIGKFQKRQALFFERAIEWSERTGGAFDPTVGKIVKLWGIGTESAAVPDPEQLKEAVDMTDFRKGLRFCMR